MERVPYALTLAYGGKGFAGWQRQVGRPSVQAAVEDALARLGVPVSLAAAGRTDAGVHARRQVASFRIRRKLDPIELLAALNRELPHGVRALALRIAAPAFHARSTAKRREYRFRISCGLPFSATAWSHPDLLSLPQLPPTGRLDLDRMRAFLADQLGRKDRAPFTTRPLGSHETTLFEAELRARPRAIGERCELRFVGSGFTRHLVRNWSWAAAALGCGVPWDFSSPRGWHGPRAPGRGLILWDVDFGGEEDG